MRTISRSPISAEVPPRRHSLAAGFGYAFAGLAAAWRTQRNVRIHALIAVIVLVAAAALRVPSWGWAVLALAIAVVFAVELLNTALEAVVDLASPGEHPLAKRAKDIAAGAVLIASFGAARRGRVRRVRRPVAMTAERRPGRSRDVCYNDPRLSTDPLPRGRRRPKPPR